MYLDSGANPYSNWVIYNHAVMVMCVDIYDVRVVCCGWVVAAVRVYARVLGCRRIFTYIHRYLRRYPRPHPSYVVLCVPDNLYYGARARAGGTCLVAVLHRAMDLCWS